MSSGEHKPDVHDDPEARDDDARPVPVAWDALEDAFENNAPDVHSYLHLKTGEVVRIVDGTADPSMHRHVIADPLYLRVDPVSSREQYRWMECFIATVEDTKLAQRLTAAIDGKGAFRRFKDVLMGQAVERERWFTFRSERLAVAMEAWLEAHEIKVATRPRWHVPTAEEALAATAATAATATGRPASSQPPAGGPDSVRQRMHEAVEALEPRDLDTALAFIVFLRQERHRLRREAHALDGRGADGGAGDGLDDAER
ncbi:MAG: hypothetical protein KC543_05880 [Myxococcales bacterium]|nr:hypothetical protein [Myxococcales bacterium]